MTESSVMRAGAAVVAILCALIIGRLTGPEPPPRIERVREPVMITAPACPIPPPKRRTTLEDVRKDWNMEGRLVCELRQRR